MSCLGQNRVKLKKYNMVALSTKEMNQPAARPLQGGLISAKFLSEYPDFEFSNVDDYLYKKFD